MEILDVHNHYYPPEYLDAAARRAAARSRSTRTRTATRASTIPGDYNIVVQGHRDIDYRQDILDELGVTKQVITFTTPGVHVETPALAAEWARLVNDCMGTDREGALAPLLGARHAAAERSGRRRSSNSSAP